MERDDEQLLLNDVPMRAVGRLGPSRDGWDGACQRSACTGNADGGASSGSGSGRRREDKVKVLEEASTPGPAGGVSTDATKQMRSPAGEVQCTHSAAGRASYQEAARVRGRVRVRTARGASSRVSAR
jgi:hypothetical protein